MSKKKKSGANKPASPERACIEDSPSVPSATPSRSEALDLKGETPGPNNGPAKSRISRYISFGLLLGVVALVGILFYEVMAQFLIPLFLAAVLVVVFRPLHRWIAEKCSGREKLSALLTTAAVLLVVLIPIGILLVMAAAESRHFYRQFNATRIVEGVRQIRTNMKLDMPSKQELRQIDNGLSLLQESITFTPAEEYSHQSGLYEIEEAAKKLASQQGLNWPSNPASDANTPSENSDWFLFASDLMQARVLHNEIPWRSDENKSSNEQRNESLRKYQVKLNETAEHFATFRTRFLGGKTKAWITELANPSDEETETYAASTVSLLRDRLFRLTGAGVAYVGKLLLGTAIMIIGLYFFLLDGPKMIETFKGLSPIDDEHEQELVAEFARVSRAVVLATLISALVQGLLAGIGFYFAGLDSVILLTVMSALLAMVPFVGAAAIWVPCCFYLYFFDHNLAAAIGLGVYGAAIISMADNVIKPYILHGQSNIHPLFALLSVLGGVAALGPIGIVIGPMVVAFLQTLLKMLRSEMVDLDQMDHAVE